MSLVGRLRRFFAPRRSVEVCASYDAARSTNETKQVWANADALDADAANSLAVRKKLRERSRYERANNGYCAGIIQTHANYIIGTGPRLRIGTTSAGFNSMVENYWRQWAAASGFNRVLRTMAISKTGDGEAFCTLAVSERISTPVKLLVVPVECDRVTAPVGVAATERYIDGITFDADGLPVSYDILDRHPGADWFPANGWGARTYAAEFVCHWFRADRPGQHRGIPEITPALNLFGTSRRYREAVVAAAETAADFAAVLEMGSPGEGPDEARPFTSMPIEKRMFVTTPAGAKLSQLKADQPTTAYDTFTRQMVCESARPLNMPYNIAACDSSGYSFSGGRLDHLTYWVSVDVERQDCEQAILEKVFATWFAHAVREYRFTNDDPAAPPHTWTWPASPQIDPEKTATARQIALSTGTTTLGRIYAEDGLDVEDELAAMAAEYGTDVETLRARLMTVNLSGTSGAASDDTSPDGSDDSNGDGSNNRPARATFAHRNGNGRVLFPLRGDA